MALKGLIFDMDGTLLDSMAVWDNAGARYLRSRGVTEIPPDLGDHIAPLSMQETADYFNRTFSLDMRPQQMIDEMNAQIADEYRYRVPLKPGVADFLRQNAHLPMCVATASDRMLVRETLERLGIGRYFAFIITSTEVGNSKRSPDIFLQAARRLGCGTDEVIVFEDAPHAIETAKKAGFYVAAVSEAAFASQRLFIEKRADWYGETLADFSISEFYGGKS